MTKHENYKIIIKSRCDLSLLHDKMNHKSPKCIKKQRDLTFKKKKLQSNTCALNEPLYIFFAFMQDSIILEHWILDSGASQHMSPLKTLFQNYEPFDSQKLIYMGDNSCHKTINISSIWIQLSTIQPFVIIKVLYILGLIKNLILVSQITNINNIEITFRHENCVITTTSLTNHKYVYTTPT